MELTDDNLLLLYIKPLKVNSLVNILFPELRVVRHQVPTSKVCYGACYSVGHVKQGLMPSSCDQTLAAYVDSSGDT